MLFIYLPEPSGKMSDSCKNLLHGKMITAKQRSNQGIIIGLTIDNHRPDISWGAIILQSPFMIRKKEDKRKNNHQYACTMVVSILVWVRGFEPPAS